jgi:hypothetical protein
MQNVIAFEIMCRFLKSEVVGMVYGTMAEVSDVETLVDETARCSTTVPLQ